PSGGRSDRPSGTGDAIPVGGTSRPASPPTGGRVGRRDDAAPVEPRVRRQSSREIPTTPPERRSAPPKPRSFAPRGASASAGSSRPPRARAPRGRQGSGTRVMPAAAQAEARRTPPPGGGAGAAAATAGGRGFRVRKGRVVALVL